MLAEFRRQQSISPSQSASHTDNLVISNRNSPRRNCPQCWLPRCIDMLCSCSWASEKYILTCRSQILSCRGGREVVFCFALSHPTPFLVSASPPLSLVCLWNVFRCTGQDPRSKTAISYVMMMFTSPQRSLPQKTAQFSSILFADGNTNCALAVDSSLTVTLVPLVPVPKVTFIFMLVVRPLFELQASDRPRESAML